MIEHLHIYVYIQRERERKRDRERKRENGQLSVEQILLKKPLIEIPDDRESVKKKLSEVKERVLVIARAENARKRRQEKRKTWRNFEKKKKQRLNSPRNCSRGRKMGSSIYQKRIWKCTFGKIYRPTRQHSSGPSKWTKLSTPSGRKICLFTFKIRGNKKLCQKS